MASKKQLMYFNDAGMLAGVDVVQVSSWLTRGGQAELRLRAAEAVWVGNLCAVRYFVEEQNVPINSITPEEQRLIDHHRHEKRAVLALRYTLLSIATGFKQEEVANYLVDRVKKEELETRDGLGVTCLMIAVYIGNLHVARRLLDLGADLQALSDTGERSIFHAVQEGHVEMVDFLLEYAKAKGGDGLYQALLKKPCTNSDISLFLFAVGKNQLPVVQYLHERQGPDAFYQLTIIDDQEWFPHLSAAHIGHLPMLEWFLAQGVPVDLSTPTEKRTALHYACIKGKGQEKSEAQVIILVQRLVEKYHADVSIRIAGLFTAADLAFLSGYRRVASYLRGKKDREEKLRRAMAAVDTAVEELFAEEDEAAVARAAAPTADAAVEELLAEEALTTTTTTTAPTTTVQPINEQASEEELRRATAAVDAAVTELLAEEDEAAVARAAAVVDAPVEERFAEEDEAVLARVAAVAAAVAPSRSSAKKKRKKKKKKKGGEQEKGEGDEEEEEGGGGEEGEAQEGDRSGGVAEFLRGEEMLRRATAAADAAAAALLAEEDEAAATRATRSAKKKRKKKKGGKKGGETAETQEKEGDDEDGEEEEGEEEEAREGDRSGGVAGLLAGLNIAADGNEDSKEDTPSFTTTTTTTTTTTPTTTAPPTTEQAPPPPPTPPFSLDDYLLQHAPKAYICPISHSLFNDPVLAYDGWSYERVALTQWVETCVRKGKEVTSPMMGNVMGSLMVENRSMRAQVVEFCDEKRKEWEGMEREKGEGRK